MQPGRLAAAWRYLHVDSPQFAIGEVDQITTWFGQSVELDGYFLDPSEVISQLAAAGFTVMAKLGRQHGT